MERNVGGDPFIKASSAANSLRKITELGINGGILFHPARDMRQDTGLKDNSRFEKLLDGIISNRQVKSQVLGDALHVHLAHHEPPPRGRLDDSQKTQGLSRLAYRDAAHTESLCKR